MPELPEVETVKNSLKNFILGTKIIEVYIVYDGILKNRTPEKFKKTLINQTFRDIRRLGKYLFFDFDDFTLTSHLRMEGKYFIRNNPSEFTKHEHIIFKLDNGKYLSYHDVRKFGTMELTSLHEEKTLKSIQVLGPEINSDDLTTTYLYHKTKNSNRPIKSLLLDQHIVSGLGNIYVDETLFKASVCPMALAKDLNIYQIEKIIKSGKSVIEEAILLGGTTIRTYQSSLGVDGRFQLKLMVHTLVGQPCKLCKDKILKTRVGGRGTYYCPTCQREDKSLIIGLTGGIASGKSFVSDFLVKEGIPVLDADKIYKDLLINHKIMYNKIAQTFGETVVNNGVLDTSALGKIVFNDSEKLKLLNSITHPFVLETMSKKINKLLEKQTKTIVLDIPLLFEAKLEYLTDLIILVNVDFETQLKRLMLRDKISKEVAVTKINSQMKLSDKIKLSDIIINNNNSEQQTILQIKEIINNIRSD